jgi:beta-glucosidase
VPQLSEKPGIDVANMLNVENFFSGGRARAPWTLSIVDAGGSRQVESGPLDSSYGLLKTRSVDVAAQEDGKSFVWTGPASFRLSGPNADMTRQLNNSFALRIDWRVDSAAPATLTFGGANIDLGALIAAAPAGKVATIKIPLRCFTTAGADLTRVDAPVTISGDQGLALTLVNTNVEAVGENLACPPAAK